MKIRQKNWSAVKFIFTKNYRNHLFSGEKLVDTELRKTASTRETLFLYFNIMQNAEMLGQTKMDGLKK
ncbi:hypothetical protein SAMN04489760_1457 [Syntrophus gentianae]|uniref:Uncharacterized protein n=1 Tax=Syntrophus gentianae TaxID=43775 RepID=A0A1H8B1U7_9BACT|nr:hypothetical protein SAMN04489760_1457 [Syntrophus gentianae]